MENKATSIEAYQLFHKGILAFARAERQGIRIDTEYVGRKEKQLTKKIERNETKLYNTEFYKDWIKNIKKKPNIYSGTQLGNYLYNVKDYKSYKITPSGKGATDVVSLSQLDIPELNIILENKKLKKIRDTYLKAFSRETVNGYIHPFFNLHTVITYRSSSNSPNFQNIPARDKYAMSTIRKAIYPRKGYQLMEADFSSLEVNIAACYHKDKNMIKYLTNPKSDMHGDVAKQIFMIDNFDKKIPGHAHLRKATKNSFIFPQFYGDYYGNNALSFVTWCKLPEKKFNTSDGVKLTNTETICGHLINKGIKSFKDFENHLQDIEEDFWNNRFKDYGNWRKRILRFYKSHGYIDLYTGFRCSGVMTKNNVINYPVQGAAFHCLLFTFIEMDKYIIDNKLKSKIIGQIHDSIILDIHPSELQQIALQLKYIAEIQLQKTWDWIIVPLHIEIEICDVNNSWDKKKLMPISLNK